MDSRDHTPPPAEDDDHVWRFAIEPMQDRSPDEDPLVELVRTFLADFCRMGRLTAGGAPIDVDGFTFNADATTIHAIFPAGSRQLVKMPERRAPTEDGGAD